MAGSRSPAPSLGDRGARPARGLGVSRRAPGRGLLQARRSPRLAPADRGLRPVGVAGAWPVWRPSLGFGRPLLADPSAQVLYPLTWLNLLMRPWRYYTLFVVVHALLSTVGLFALARRFGLRLAGAFVSAALWLLAGPLVEHRPLASLRGHVLAALGGPRGRPGPRDEDVGSRRSPGERCKACKCWRVRRRLHHDRDRDSRPRSRAPRPLGATGRGLQLRLLGVGALASLTALGLAAGLWMPALDQVSRAARRTCPPRSEPIGRCILSASWTPSSPACGRASP